MSHEIEACVECTKQCLRFHGKKQTSSPSVAKFFKVMIGDQFSKVLYIPPKFSPMVSSLIGQKTFLEDSNGKKWETQISKLNVSFAFQQGWQLFASGHGLGVGDFLVFYYITGSHFVVDIYDKSGCQKLDFPVNISQKKRARRNRNYVDEGGTSHTVDIDSNSKQSPVIPTVSGSDIEISQSQFENNVAEVKMAMENHLNCEFVKRPQPVSQVRDMEDTNYIINRDIGDQHGKDRHILFDLSQFEMWGNNSGIDESKSGIVGDVRYYPDISAGLHIEAGLVNEHSAIEEVRTGALALAASKFEFVRNKNDTSLIDKLAAGSDKDTCNKIAGHPSTNTSATKPIRDEDDCTDMSNKIQRTKNSLSMPEIDKLVLSWKKRNSLARNNLSAQVKLTGISKSGGGPLTTSLSQCQSGETSKTIKKEAVEMTQSIHSWREEVTKVMEGGAQSEF
ncbi:hypothetical protein HS088_TW19G00525 [Tripterygium wilfordii]|uniref:TF-B3 domain-containing protein n=1 Tax=Tripterygium wilfordii TaxID=458696 RepID=A0A7J7C9W1_TRIWF|nr:hypothetical protein HS088_TW19G00525 [Tripterygium wilfordii]